MGFMAFLTFFVVALFESLSFSYLQGVGGLSTLGLGGGGVDTALRRDARLWGALIDPPKVENPTSQGMCNAPPPPKGADYSVGVVGVPGSVHRPHPRNITPPFLSQRSSVDGHPHRILAVPLLRPPNASR